MLLYRVARRVRTDVPPVRQSPDRFGLPNRRLPSAGNLTSEVSYRREPRRLFVKSLDDMHKVEDRCEVAKVSLLNRPVVRQPIADESFLCNRSRFQSVVRNYAKVTILPGWRTKTT